MMSRALGFLHMGWSSNLKLVTDGSFLEDRLNRDSQMCFMLFSNCILSSLEASFLPWSTNLFASKTCVFTNSLMRCLVAWQPLFKFPLFFQFMFLTAPLTPSLSHGFQQLSLLFHLLIHFHCCHPLSSHSLCLSCSMSTQLSLADAIFF